VMLDAAGGTGLDAIRGAGPKDVLLAASVEPYARATIDSARYAAGRGVPVVALTDSEVTPLAQIASASIPVAIASPSFFHTMTPLLAATEILAALVAGPAPLWRIVRCVSRNRRAGGVDGHRTTCTDRDSRTV